MIFQVGFSVAVLAVRRPSPRDAASRSVRPLQRGLLSASGDGSLPVPVPFPDTSIARGLGASVGAYSGSRETSLLLCGVGLSPRNLQARLPGRRVLTPGRERGRLLPGTSPWPHGWGHSSAAPEPAQSGGPQSQRHRDPKPPSTATRMLSALPAQPTATATPYTSEQGEKLPTPAAPGAPACPGRGGGSTPGISGGRTPQRPLLLPAVPACIGSAVPAPC